VEKCRAVFEEWSDWAAIDDPRQLQKTLENRWAQALSNELATQGSSEARFAEWVDFSSSARWHGRQFLCLNIQIKPSLSTECGTVTPVSCLVLRTVVAFRFERTRPTLPCDSVGWRIDAIPVSKTRRLKRFPNMSRMENCVLVDGFTGKDILRLTRQEADSMVSNGKAVRIPSHGKRWTGTHKYRMVVPVTPSNSEDSMAELNAGDSRVAAGLFTPTVEQAERLHGWGFHVKQAMCEVCEEMVSIPHSVCA
jgi:hypothetical protein